MILFAVLVQLGHHLHELGLAVTYAEIKTQKEGPHAAHKHAFPAGVPQVRFWAQAASGWHRRPDVCLHEMRVQGSCGPGARADKAGQKKQSVKPRLLRRLFLFKDAIILEKKLARS